MCLLRTRLSSEFDYRDCRYKSSISQPSIDAEIRGLEKRSKTEKECRRCVLSDIESEILLSTHVQLSLLSASRQQNSSFQ